MFEQGGWVTQGYGMGVSTMRLEKAYEPDSIRYKRVYTCKGFKMKGDIFTVSNCNADHRMLIYEYHMMIIRCSYKQDDHLMMLTTR